MSLRSDVDEALRDARAAIEEAQRAFDRALERQPFVPRSEAGALRDEAFQVQLRALDLQRHATHLRLPSVERSALALCERLEPCASCGSDDLTHVEDAGTPLVLCLGCGARRER